MKIYNIKFKCKSRKFSTIKKKRNNAKSFAQLVFKEGEATGVVTSL